MKRSIYSAINYLLKPFDLSLQDRDLQWEREVLFALFESKMSWSEKKIHVECIIFSKDRALQLHALLSTYFEKISSPAPVHVLYDTSTASHQKAYDELIDRFTTYQVSFIRQKDSKSFREDTISLLKSIDSEKVLFLVDDNIFIEDIDMADFTKFSTDRFVPTLRMGTNLSECFPLQRKQPQPEFLVSILEEPDKIVWKWGEGIYDWGYPLSLDGHLFSTREITVISEHISFSAPNSYESNLQRLNWLFLPRLGVCYRKSKIINIACNKVQTENDNICGSVHQDFLLEKWNNGLQMNFRPLYGFLNKSAHQDITFDFIRR